VLLQRPIRWQQLEELLMTTIIRSQLLFCAIWLSAPTVALAVTISTVLVGDVGNANDPLTGNLYGGVSYLYRIGTTEVTNAQYADFLNAKAKSDPLALYNTEMGFNNLGGIARSRASGSFTYAPKTNMANKPVNFVSWYDSIRFANWLNNGQGTGDTETGAYTLGTLGPGGVPTLGNSIVRNAGVKVFLPSENEWYKAAYYQPSAQGGDADSYWEFPTASNSLPTLAGANSVGDISNPGINVANYFNGAKWNNQPNVTTVGSAGPLSQSFYGTSDQAGNVIEWNEALIVTFQGDLRSVRGGSFGTIPDSVRSSAEGAVFPTEGDFNFGFRIATIPEPGTAVLTIIACGLMWVLRKRFK
jgi:formylglycine-generating enzyme